MFIFELDRDECVLIDQHGRLSLRFVLLTPAASVCPCAQVLLFLFELDRDEFVLIDQHYNAMCVSPLPSQSNGMYWCILVPLLAGASACLLSHKTGLAGPCIHL